MIVLDTNVISELTRDTPSSHVVAWVDAHPPKQQYMTAVTAAELLYGIARLPEGRRRAAMAVRAGKLLDEYFAQRILAFTGAAAPHYADIAASRERTGRPIRVADAQIAAICRLHGAHLATRNVKDFTDTGIRISDPWEADG